MHNYSTNSITIQIQFQCKVLPPKQLLHPVLPTRVDGKLLFHLCRSCAEMHNQGLCEHTDEERQFWGAWPTVELYKALEKGYRYVSAYIQYVCILYYRVFSIVTISEVYHYDSWAQMDEQNPNSGLFTEYINTFLKTKQQVRNVFCSF